MVSVRQRTVETCIALSLASAALAVALRTGVAARESLDVLQGICRELLSGSTVGRQALAGSCWQGPLPIFFSTCFAWCDRVHGATPLALAVASWCGWSLALYRLGRMVSASLTTRLMAQAAAAAGIASCGGALNPAVAVPAWLGILAAGACAEWASTRRLGALATLGFTLGALALCGVCLAGWVVLLLGTLVAATLVSVDARRLPAVLLLGALPWIYALAVWALLNWLLLGHPLYFVRPLLAANVLVWRGWPDSGSIVARLVVVTPTPDGKVNQLVLAAAHLAGVDEIWRVGGAHAVAALAGAARAAGLGPQDVKTDGMKVTIMPLKATVEIAPLEVKHGEATMTVSAGKPGWSGPHHLPGVAWIFRAMKPGSLVATLADEPKTASPRAVASSATALCHGPALISISSVPALVDVCSTKGSTLRSTGLSARKGATMENGSPYSSTMILAIFCFSSGNTCNSRDICHVANMPEGFS